MKLRILILIAFVILVFSAFAQVKLGAEVLNIAHRGASGYLPEHTLPAKALAYGLGSDYIEQDIVLTKDDVPIIVHDIHLDTVTNVAEVYPGRARKDGRFYALDFNLSEIKTLKVNERKDLKTGKSVFPDRFPPGKSTFQISTFAEEIELIQGLNHSMKKNIGIYPEIKEPEWHKKEGHDITPIVLKVLADYGYKTKDDKCFLQCFDSAELKRIRNELKCQLSLIQLLEEDCDLKEVAKYADGIGPSIKMLIKGRTVEGKFEFTDLALRAKEAGLMIHPWTFRVDSLPFSCTKEELMNALISGAGIDGIFSDFPDISRDLINECFRETTE
ncbi:MAG: glycerophosphodiester phosphodiesterase [Candidatus Rifleibacteriota bacterium]